MSCTDRTSWERDPDRKKGGLRCPSERLFVTAKADTKDFLPDLAKKLKAVLKGFEVPVKVVPDVKGFRTILASELKKLEPVKIPLTADVPKLRREINSELRKIDPVNIPLTANIKKLQRDINAGLKTVDPVNVRLVADVPGLVAKLRADLKAAGVFIPVQLRADTTRLVAALKRDLRALPPIPIKVLPQLDTKALARAGTAAKKSADSMALHFRAAALDISASMRLMAASGIDAAERIAAAATTSNQTLRRQFGVGAGDVARRFDEAGKLIAQALSAASASGEKSLIRLAQTAQRTADSMQGSLTRAAALAAKEIQGPLRTAIDLIVKDLVELRDAGRISFADIDTAGKLAAERLAAAFGVSGKEMTSTIEAAAGKISAAIEAAAVSGVTSLEGLQSAAAIAAKQAGADFLRISQAARLASAQIIRAGNEAGASLKGSLSTAAHLAAADLAKLAEAGVLTQADIAAASLVAANAISDEFGLHSIEALHGIALFVDRATTEFRRLALSGNLTAEEIEAEFLKAFAAATVAAEAFAASSVASLETVSGTASTVARRVSAALNKSSDFAQRQFGRIASTAKTGFLAAAGTATVLAAVIGGIGIAASATVEQIQTAFKGLFSGQAQEFQDQLTDGTKRTSAEVDKLSARIKTAQSDSVNFFGQLQQFAKVTPFEFPELAGASQRLAALGLSGDQVLSVLTDVGNAVSAVGGNGENLDHVVLALGQINSYGKVTADNLNQISNALPNFNRKNFATTIAELRAVAARGKDAKPTVKELAQATEDLHNGAVDSATGIAALLQTLREAPGALGAMERQMKTLKGQISNFKDNIRINLQNAFAEVGPTGVSALQAVSNALTPLGDAIASTFGNIAPAITNLVSKAGPALNDLLTSVGNAIGPILDVVTSLFVALEPALSAIVDSIGQIFAAIGPGLTAVASALSDALLSILPALTQALEELGPTLVDLAPAFGDLVDALAPLLPFIVQLVNDGLKVLVDLLPLITPLLAAFTNTLNFLVNIPGVGEVLAGFAVTLGVLAVTLGPISTLISGIITVMFGLSAAAAAAGLTVGTLVIAIGILAIEFIAIVAVIALVAFGIKKLSDHVGGFGNLVKITFNGIVSFVGAVFKTIVSVIGIAIVDMIQIFTALPRAVLYGFTQILKGLAHLPKWLGGGAFDSAAGAVQGLLDTVNAGVNGLISEVNRGVDGVNAAIDNITKAVQVDVTIKVAVVGDFGPTGGGGFGANARAAEEATGTDTVEKAKADALEAARKAALKKFKPIVPSDLSKGLGVEKAKDKAKEAAQKFRDAIKSILDSLDADFKHGLIYDKAQDIKKTLNKLASDIIKAFDEAGKKRPTKLIDRIAADNKTLQQKANDRDKIVKQLEAATAKFSEVRTAVLDSAKLSALDFSKAASSAADTLQKLNVTTLDVAGSFQVVSRETQKSAAEASDQVVKTAATFAAALKARKDQILQFQKDVKALIKLGLDKDLIDQLLTSSDFEGASALAKASKKTIDDINTSQRAIEKAANQLGNTAADQFFRQGGHIVDGLIAGLKDKKSTIIKEMTDIATALIKAIRKTLKIASPSKVAMGLMGHFGDGLVLGLHGKIADIENVARRVSDAAMPALGSVNLPRIQGGTSELRSTGARSGNMLSRQDIAELKSVMSMARSQTVHHAPVTIKTAAPQPVVERALSVVLRRS